MRLADVDAPDLRQRAYTQQLTRTDSMHASPDIMNLAIEIGRILRVVGHKGWSGAPEVKPKWVAWMTSIVFDGSLNAPSKSGLRCGAR